MADAKLTIKDLPTAVTVAEDADLLALWDDSDNTTSQFSVADLKTSVINPLIAAEAALRSAADVTLQNNIDLKADIDSPTLTGIPLAPTATSGTDTDQLATTAFVKAAVDTASGAVVSVNGDTGAVVLDATSVGLGGFTGLTPATLPLSTAETAALATKEPSISSGLSSEVWQGDKTWVAKTSLPISTAQQTALDAKEPTITGTSSADVWQGDKTWTPKSGLPVSTAQQAAINLAIEPLIESYVSVTSRTFAASTKAFQTRFYNPSYAVQTSLVGPGRYVRISFASLTGFPATSYIRSLDRFMPDGSTDATNGGYWVYSPSDMINPDCLGAVRDNSTDCASIFNDALTLAYLTGRAIQPRAYGKYYIGSAINIRWGVSVIGEKGCTLRMAGGFNFTDPSVTVYPALYIFSTFRDIIFEASGIVPYAINAITDLNNSTGPGIICGLAVQSCTFGGPAATIAGYRANPTNFFFKSIYTFDVAYCDLDDLQFMGGFEIGGPILAAEDSCAVHFDGQTIRLSWQSNNNAVSYCYALRGTGDVEGFHYMGGEVVYCRYGIHVQSTTNKPGAYITGGHFNVSEAGVTLVNRNVGKVTGINCFTNTFYEARTTWTALKLDTCTDIVVSNIQSRPSFNAAWAGTSRGLWVNASSRITGTGLDFRFTNIASAANGLAVDLFTCTDSLFNNIIGDTLKIGIRADSACSNVTFGAARFTTTTTPWSISASATNIFYTSRRGVPDGAATIITAAGSETLTVANSFRRLRFNAGSGAYAYTITLGATDVVMSDELVLNLQLNSVNPTVSINDNTGATLVTLNSATNIFKSVRASWNGTNWRLEQCCTSDA